MICNWTTYRGNFCKKIIHEPDTKFCVLHHQLINEYLKVVNKTNEDVLFCDTFKEIKVVPRNHRHIKSVMKSINNEDDRVQVYLTGGLIEDADIGNTDYIVLDSDSSKFYYDAKKGQNRAKDLKIVLRSFCQNDAVINFRNKIYCKECYEKLKDVPRISLIPNI